MEKANIPMRRILARFIHDTSYANIPKEVRRFAKYCLLDFIGVSIAGSRQRVSSVIGKVVSSTGGGEDATVWGSDCKVPVVSAALLNAVQGHAIDMDDGHRYANGHPGVVTIPPAVAIAEVENMTGQKLIEALIIGYDIFIRLGSAINPDLLLRGFHTTSTIGVFASAAVTSKLLGLNVYQIENALSLAGLQSSGLLEALVSGEMGKSFQVGKASQSGVIAGLLAREGADGPVDIFEGQKGFFNAFASRECDLQAVNKELGGSFHMTDVYFKKHAACRHIHPALDAIIEILAKHQLRHDEIETIEIETYSIANSLTGHLSEKASELASKFSMPVAVALLLVFGESDAAAYQQQYLSDPRVRDVARKVSVLVSPERDKLYPHQRGASVVIRIKNKLYQHEVNFPSGEPENPLGDNELIQKFEQNALTIYSRKRVGNIRDAVMEIDTIAISELVELLKAP